METKVIVYVAIGIVAVIIGIVVILPSSGIFNNMMSQNANVPSALTSVMIVVKPLDVQYNGSSILSIQNRDAALETKFNLSNPNDNTLIIEMISYDVYVNDVLIGHGQYGQKYEGSSESSTYLPLTKHNSEIITTKMGIHDTGNNQQAWSAVHNGTGKIRILGTVFYSTHSPFAGQTYSKDFNFTK